jgi:uncharacterized protein YjbI with pentapeptide repeats
MANPEHLAILKQGVEVWNKWRIENKEVIPDLIGADLVGADLIEFDLSGANLRRADFRIANLRGVDFCGANLIRANLIGANLIECRFSGAKFIGASLSRANLSRSNLSKVELAHATLVQTDFTGATLSGCNIYGISAWDVKLDDTIQNELIITQSGQPIITVDNLEVAQFIYLLLNNSKLRNVIDTLTGKAVLILGRFGERKSILDSIADELRKKNYLPIMFDFDRPLDKTLTETVLTLAGLSKFVIAVMSDPNSVPWEVANIKVFDIPIVPLIQEDQKVFPMFDDLKLKPGFIQPIQYKNSDHIKQLMESLLLTAEGKHKELRELKAL